MHWYEAVAQPQRACVNTGLFCRAEACYLKDASGSGSSEETKGQTPEPRTLTLTLRPHAPAVKCRSAAAHSSGTCCHDFIDVCSTSGSTFLLLSALGCGKACLSPRRGLPSRLSVGASAKRMNTAEHRRDIPRGKININRVGISSKLEGEAWK